MASTLRAPAPGARIPDRSGFFGNLKIGTKVLLISVIALVGFVVVFATVMVADMMRDDVRDTQEAALGELMGVGEVAENFLNARRREKDFLLRKEQSYADKHAEVSRVIVEDDKRSAADGQPQHRRAAESAEGDL